MGIASQENLKTRGVWGHVLWKIFSTKDPNLCYTKVIFTEVMITDIMKLCANAFSSPPHNFHFNLNCNPLPLIRTTAVIKLFTMVKLATDLENL